MEKKKVVVITGGSRGLGRATALRFAKDAYTVVVLGRDEQALQATVADVSALGVEVLALECHVGDWQSVQKAFDAIVERFGRIDILVNNAGGWSGDKLADASPETITSLIESIVLGTTYCSKAALPAMQKQGSGFIINIGSASGLLNSADVAISSAPKAAVELFSRTLANEVRTNNIRVCVIHPSNMSIGNHALTYDQVAELVAYVAHQPANVAIRELIVTPTGEAF